MQNSKTEKVIANIELEIAYLSTPIGTFELKGTKKGVQSVKLKPELTTISDKKVPACLQACAQQMTEYFARKRTDFNLKRESE